MPLEISWGMSCFNPYSKEFMKERDELKKASALTQVLVWITTALTSVLTFGFAGNFVFRLLVGRVSAGHPKNQNPKLTQDINQASSKLLLRKDFKSGKDLIKETDVDYRHIDLLEINDTSRVIKVGSPNEKLNSPFKRLCDYISKQYPKFPIQEYHSIEDFQAKGYPYHFAAMNRDFNLLNLLKEAGADVNQVDGNGRGFFTIFIENISTKNITFPLVMAMAKQLIDWGVDIFQKDKFGMSAIQLIAERRQLCTDHEFAQLLDMALGSQKNVEDINDTVLQILDCYLDWEVFECALKHGISIDFNKLDEMGRSYLHKAINEHNIEFAKYLLEKGADPNLGNKKDGSLNCLKSVEMRIREIENLKKKGLSSDILRKHGRNIEEELEQWVKIKSLIEERIRRSDEG